MTRIDFYGLDDKSLDAGLRFACRLCDKALASGHLIHVHAATRPQAEQLDEMMWDYPKHRFLPHALVTGADEPASAQDAPGKAPIHIGWEAPHHTEGLLINLGEEVPTFFGRFDRVAEIIVQDTVEQGRVRYRHYQHRGYPLHYHDMAGWEDRA